jgi:(1->4)-alpha-D-glucan 1-alpha-D-glucosylmutase
LSLVDPDNRRPVDYERRRQMLEQLRAAAETDLAALVDELLASREDGRIKLFIICRALEARRNYRDVFEQGDYVPLRVTGRHAERVIAFARQQGEQLIVTVAPRLLVSLVGEDELPTGDVWRDTAIELPESASPRWRNLFTDEAVNAPQRLAVADALRRFPVALLVNEVNAAPAPEAHERR